MHRLRYLLYPFALLYKAILYLRNKFYEQGLIKSQEVPLKTIVIGNLALGGTGKTPHAALILKYLRRYQPALLSRGYGRSTKGVRQVLLSDTFADSGDEPLLLSRKYPDVPVYVAEGRVKGIKTIIKEHPGVEVVVLDDAFQHRKLKGGLYLLLTSWENPFYRDEILPVGTLRDHPIRARDAHAVIVTKCPDDLDVGVKTGFINALQLPGIPVFFSRTVYGDVKPLHKSGKFARAWSDHLHLALVSGIAQPAAFCTAAKQKWNVAKTFSYPDHHSFESGDFQHFRDFIGSFAPGKAAVLTTEKDAMRMLHLPEAAEMPIFYWEIEVEMTGGEEPFKDLILSYVALP